MTTDLMTGVTITTRDTYASKKIRPFLSLSLKYKSIVNPQLTIVNKPTMAFE